MSKLFAHITQQVPAYNGATVNSTPSGDLLVSIKKSTSCLKRFKTLQVASNYLVKQDYVIPLNNIALDDSKDTILESHSECGTRKVIVKKENEKDLWIEVWSETLNGGLL